MADIKIPKMTGFWGVSVNAERQTERTSRSEDPCHRALPRRLLPSGPHTYKQVMAVRKKCISLFNNKNNKRQLYIKQKNNNNKKETPRSRDQGLLTETKSEYDGTVAELEASHRIPYTCTRYTCIRYTCISVCLYTVYLYANSV